MKKYVFQAFQFQSEKRQFDLPQERDETICAQYRHVAGFRRRMAEKDQPVWEAVQLWHQLCHRHTLLLASGQYRKAKCLTELLDAV